MLQLRKTRSQGASPSPSPETIDEKVGLHTTCPDESSSPPPPSSSPWVPLLLRHEQVPAWYHHNIYILGAYRPVLGSLARCLYSLTYVHNETINIYTHLVPAVFALFGNYVLATYFSARYPLASWQDQLVFHIFLTSSVVCFGISSGYHTFQCHSARYYGLWIRADYVAIVLQILGSFISGIYVSFYCEPVLQQTYWFMIVALSILTIFMVVHPRLQSAEWRMMRLFAFIGTGLSAFAPILHAAALFPYQQLDKQAGLRYYYLEGVLILGGCWFYATHFPECWMPGRFDIFGASHQIFHTCIVLAAIAHMYGVLSAFHWNYENPRCSA